MEEEIQKAKRKYIKMFFEAQVITQELKRGNDNLDEQGHVYLYPESTLGMSNLTKLQTMTYLPYDSGDNNFKEKLEDNSTDIQSYFSINPEGQLVLATLVTTTIEVESETDGSSNKSTSTTHQAIEVPIDYKSMISQYATPMSFYLELGMATRNPEFLAAVVNLVKSKTNIQLTVLNTTTVETTTQVDESTYHVRSRIITEEETEDEDSELIVEYESSDETTKTTTITTTKTVTPTVKVTSVDTWICSQKITYSKIPGTPIEEEPYIIEQESEAAKSLGSDTTKEETVSWTTRKDSVVQRTSTTDTYDSGIPSDYIDNTDDFVELLDVKYKIPNSKEKRTAGTYLKTDAELFFQLLSQTPETQGMEIVMRYIMQKYDDTKDYGAGDFSFSIFDVNYFNQMGGGSVSPFGTNLTREEFISLATAYSSSSDYVNYMLKYAGDFYDICTSHNINPALAYAHACLETGNGSSSACQNNKNYFGYAHGNDSNTGKRYSSVRESIEDYCQWVIKNSTQGTSAYQSNMQTAKIYATANPKLNGTPDKNIYVLYCRYAYLGDTHISDEPSFSSPAGPSYYQSHGSNWGTGGRIYIYQMYEKGGLYTGEYSTRCGHSNGSDATTIAERADYAEYASNQRINIAKTIFGNNCLTGTSGSLIEAAYEVADHFMNSGVTVHYAGNSVQEATNNGRHVIGGNIQASWEKPLQEPSRYGVVCATYVAFSMWKAGLVDEETLNQYSYNSCTGLERMLTTSSYANQWQKITSFNDLQEGDVVFISGHVYFYMDGGKCLDQNYCVVQSSGKDTRGKLLKASAKGFRAAYRYIGK